MTRLAVLSDVHGNLHALTAVLKALDRQHVDAFLYAGDLVGYGARPGECIDLLRELPVVAVAGNHDLVAIGAEPREQCESRLARRTLEWTSTRLSQAARDYLASLPLVATIGQVTMTHGSLQDPFEYVRTPEQAGRQLQLLSQQQPLARVLVHGHTHRAWAVAERDGVVSRGARPTVNMVPHQRYLINPGSVGQPRERSPRARCAVLDMARLQATFLAVEYDVSACIRELRRHGLPPEGCHRPPPFVAGARRVLRTQLDRYWH